MTCATDTNPRPAPKSATQPEFDVTTWLDQCEAEVVHPAVIVERLRRANWPASQAAVAGASYRRRFNEHALGYSALLIATGLAALAAGSAGHTLIAGMTRPVNRRALATWLTMLLCSLPFAAAAHRWAARVDRDDPVAVWSEPRRLLARTLLWAAGIVGIGRLMIYVGQLMSVLVGATHMSGPAVTAGTLNVLVVVVISLPLGLWSYNFLHRFDSEDPTAPVTHRRRQGR
jgi:hypothetical protein